MLNKPADIAKLYIMVGYGKTVQKSWVLFLLGIFAGAFIAFGGLTSQIVSCGVAPAALGRFLSGVVFPVGLMMVIISGGELFTGNCLIFISVLSKETYFSAMLRNWAFVYLGNLVGGIAIALLANFGQVLNLYDGELARLAFNTAKSKITLPFHIALIKGILCNFLVCISVWVSFSTEENVPGKIASLYLPILLFVICGFEHCVANMYFIPAGILAKYLYGYAQDASFLSFLTGDLLPFFGKNLLPVTLGNIIGGFLVATGYWLIYLSQPDDD